MSPAAQKSRRTQADFKGASSDDGVKKKWYALTFRMKLAVGIGLPVAAFLIYVAVLMSAAPPKGNNLYGLCRAYIELHVQYPQTLKVIELKQKIPDGENAQNPQRINYELTVSYVDGFGNRLLNTVTCGIKFNPALAQTPWQGIYLDRVMMNSHDLRPNHGMVDVYYPPDQKEPRRADDYNENLEIFFNGIPSLLVNPPDLTLPRYSLDRLDLEDLQSLNEED